MKSAASRACSRSVSPLASTSRRSSVASNLPDIATSRRSSTTTYTSRRSSAVSDGLDSLEFPQSRRGSSLELEQSPALEVAMVGEPASAASGYPVAGCCGSSESQQSPLSPVSSSSIPSCAESPNSLWMAMEVGMWCQPWNYSFPKICIPTVLPTIASWMPGNDLDEASLNPEMRRMHALLFEERQEGCGGPLFQQMLKNQEEQVHFFYMWRGLSEARRLLVCSATHRARPAKQQHIVEGVAENQRDCLVTELETLRDSILRLMESEEGSKGEALSSRSIRRTSLAQILEDSRNMSAVPELWMGDAAEALVSLSVDGPRSAGNRTGRIKMGELVHALMDLLHMAELLQPERVISGSGRFLGCLPPLHKISCGVEPSSQEGGLAVSLNIYDVSQETFIQRVNDILANEYSPLKFGGVFHAAVEINGLEWSFAKTPDGKSGVECSKPRCHPSHHFRETVQLSCTDVSAEMLAGVISNIIEEYPGCTYDLLRRNCCHFCEDFCERLGAGPFPGWVHRLARAGASIDATLKVLKAGF